MSVENECPKCGLEDHPHQTCTEADKAESHNCIDHLQLQQHEWIEPHGEPCYQEWWVCSWCYKTFTDREVERIVNVEPL